MQIQIKVKDKRLTLVGKPSIVCGNTDYTIKFELDDEWSAITTKKARFKYGTNYTDVTFTGDTCAVPQIDRADSVLVGLFADDHATMPVKIKAKGSILCAHGLPED